MNAGGTVTLQLLRPIQIAEWGTLSIVATTPLGTSIKVQAMDDADALYYDTFVPGNSTGISAFPVDLSGASVISCAKQYYDGAPGLGNEFQSCTKKRLIR